MANCKTTHSDVPEQNDRKHKKSRENFAKFICLCASIIPPEFLVRKRTKITRSSSGCKQESIQPDIRWAVAIIFESEPLLLKRMMRQNRKNVGDKTETSNFIASSYVRRDDDLKRNDAQNPIWTEYAIDA